jgi:hypothetical protein
LGWWPGAEKIRALLAIFAIFGLRAEFNRFEETGEGTIGGGGCFKIIMVILGNNFEHVSVV